MSAFLVTFGLIGAICGLLYLFFVWNFGHWKKRGIREAKSYPLFGSFPGLITQKRHQFDDILGIYRTFKKTENFVGVYNIRTPQLLILDPECVHKVLVNDFRHFHDNEISTIMDDKSDILFGNNPFFLTGKEWKERRNEVTPGLTPIRIKNAYPVTLQVCKTMNEFIKQQIKMPSKDGIDTNDLCLRYTTELVSDVVLGVKAQSFTNNPMPIMPYIKKLLDFDFSFILMLIFPFIKKVYKFKFVPDDVAKFFSQLVQKAMDLRRAQGNKRVDFLNYMLQLQDKKGLTTPEVTSNVMTFLTDGFLTTASAVAHCLLLLARNPKEQEKLLKEIMENLDENGEINFEKINELPFLDACFHEGLRIFPPGFVSSKLVTAPHQLTNKDGTVLKLKVNDVVVLPTHSIHHDEQYYDNPELFKPDRFLPENGGHKLYREKGLFLGFGDGPRTCIGMRFALTQGKAAIAEIVKTFNIKSNSRTRSDNIYDPKDPFAGLKDGIWLDYELRS